MMAVGAQWRRVRRLGAAFAAGATLAGLQLVPTVATAAEHAAHGAPLTINFWTWDSHAPPMGWFLFDFAIFMGGLIYFSAKPLATAFAQRHQKIKRAIGEAASAHATAISEQHAWREKLSKVEGEIKELQRSSQADGEADRDRIIAEAQAYATRLQADGVAQADQELRQAKDRLRRTLLDKTLSRAAAQLQATLTDADRIRLMDESIVLLGQPQTAGMPTQRLRSTP
jgi:F0F1-type ATP synthase membrane subunit b/b'